MAEIIRSLDVYLAWDDPTYTLYTQAPQKVGQFIPWINRRGFPSRVQ